MKLYLRFILSLFLAFTSCQPAFALTKVDGSLLKGDVIGGTASDTRRIVVPKDTKANLDAKTRLEANLVYGTDTKKAYIDNGTDLIAVGSGSGGAVNLITDGDAENAISSIFVPYKDAAASRPVDGVGASADVTTAVTSTAPLTGAKSFTITKDAVNRQGQGWSIPFTVPLSMQAKVLQIEVDYIVNSGTFVAGSSSADSDVIWYLYDITNSTLIEPSSIKVLSSSSTLSDKFRSTFQTSATGTSYRLIAHVATTSAAAYELKVEASVSPSVYVYGTPITDWASYTTGCTGAWVTNTTYTCKKRRVGDNYEYNIKLATSGAPTATALLINIPDTVDTAKINSTISYASALENSSIAYDSGNGYPVKVSYYSATQVAVTNNVSPQALVAHNVPFTFGAGDEINIRFSLPIVGLSSSVQMSDSADTRVVSFIGTSTGTTATANVTNLLFTTVKDSHGAWNGSVYTVLVAGDYLINGSLVSPSANTVAIYLNGSVYKNLIYNVGTAGGSGSQIIPDLKAGDTISIRSNVSQTFAARVDDTFCISRISGPSAIAASEIVAAKYNLAAASSITNGSQINFSTKIEDTHGAVTTGASWKFTAPIAGLYSISTLQNANAAHNYQLYKNGVAGDYLSGAPVANYLLSGRTQIRLNAGDYIDVRPDATVTTQSVTYISINKL